MKKISLLLLAVIMTFVLTGCDEKVEDQIATCTSQQDTHHETIVLSGTNGEVTRFEAIYKYENSTFGITSLEGVTEDQKQTFVDNMYNNLGFEKDKEYEGFEIKITFEDQVVVEFASDIKNDSANANLKKLGIDFSNTDLDFDNAVQSYRTKGYTCK